MSSTASCSTSADRTSDRLQVFSRDGKFVKEIFVEPESLADGSTWTWRSRRTRSRSTCTWRTAAPELHIYDRQSLTELTNFGEAGTTGPVLFDGTASPSTRRATLYTTETYQGRRVQKFVYKGLGPVTKKEQGTIWPTRTSAR